MGLCQIAFLFNKKAKIVTHAMIRGANRHNELQRRAEVFTEEEIIEKIVRGEQFVAREISVADHENGLRGRIDELQFLGRNTSGKNAVMIKDDKFSYSNFLGMNDTHRIQLSSYAFMMPKDAKFKNLVEVVGAAINFRKFDAAPAVEFRVSGKQLVSWTEEIPMLAELANDILSKQKAPEPYSFALMGSEWLPVSKQACTGCKYNKICSVGRKMLADGR